LLAAIAEIRKQPAICLQAVSSFHETAPVGGPPGQANYFNAAVAIETKLSPADLQGMLAAIEQKLGRTRAERWGPRTVDLDLLLYGDSTIETPELTIPHPRMAERRFVLAPAAEIAADLQHPRTGKTIGQMLAELPAAAEGANPLRVFTSPTDMQATILRLREAGRRIGIVPTMGALHPGHLSLVEVAKDQADVVVATIFVNPTQFGPKEDFGKYPRTLDNDLTALSAAGCDLVFVPASEDIFPPGFSAYVEPPDVAQPLEGVCRPGHFRGVATVVLKLFHLIPAHIACFGQKDFQQLLVIRHLVRDLALPIEILPCPTIREPDGLALSSRNRYLSPTERQQALALSRALRRAEELVSRGERDSQRVIATMRTILTEGGIRAIDYIAVADRETLAELPVLDCPAVALVAAHVGATRLIDNCLLTPLS
jgi:pantoate--beta-alanine ligase